MRRHDTNVFRDRRNGLILYGRDTCASIVDGRGDPAEDPELRGTGRPRQSSNEAARGQMAAHSPRTKEGNKRLIPAPIWVIAACALSLLAWPRSSWCGDQSRPADSPVAGALSPAVGNLTIEWAVPPPEDMAQSAETIVSALRGRAAPDAFSQGMRRLLGTLIAAGYRNAAISPRDFSLQDGSLGCVLHIALGPRAYVSAQQFAGLVHTDTAWIRRLVAMPLDVPLTASWIDRARQRLQSISCLRIIETPEVVLIPSDSPDREDAILRWRLQESRPVRLDGMVAAGGESVGGLTGRGSVKMAGLLGRDRSVALNYQRMSLARTQLAVRLAEAGAFGIPLDWGLSLDESDQSDHRQGIAADLRYGVGHSAQWRVESEARWRKVTPGTSAIAPSRAVEIALGMSHETGGVQSHDLFDIPSRHAFMVTFSKRREFASAALSNPETSDDRMLLKWDFDQAVPWNSTLSARVSATGRNWLRGANRLGPGDEWYLGGADLLRGYSDHDIAAASGAWAALEIRDRFSPSAAVSLFAEGALLRDLNPDGGNSRKRAPYGYGGALWLLSPDRIGRLEFAWRDHAAWRDGLIRLRVSQSW